MPKLKQTLRKLFIRFGRTRIPQRSSTSKYETSKEAKKKVYFHSRISIVHKSTRIRVKLQERRGNSSVT